VVKGTIRDLALTMFLAIAGSAAGITWIDFDIPGTWPAWLGPDAGGEDKAATGVTDFNVQPDDGSVLFPVGLP
jgi:hypothetical protein